MQFGFDQPYEALGFPHAGLGAHAQTLLLDLFQAGHAKGHLQGTVAQAAGLLAFVPDLFTHVAGPGRRYADLHRVEFIPHDPKAVAQIVVQVETVRYLNGKKKYYFFIFRLMAADSLDVDAAVWGSNILCITVLMDEKSSRALAGSALRVRYFPAL